MEDAQSAPRGATQRLVADVAPDFYRRVKVKSAKWDQDLRDIIVEALNLHLDAREGKGPTPTPKPEKTPHAHKRAAAA